LWKKVGEYRQREDHKLRGHPGGTNAPQQADRKDSGKKDESQKKDKSELKKEHSKKHKEDKKKKKDHEDQNEDWTPIWFVIETDVFDKPIWNFTNSYWDIRSEREKLEADKPGSAGPLYTPTVIKGTAADFSEYHNLWSDLLGKENEEDTKDKEKAEKTKKQLKEKAKEEK